MIKVVENEGLQQTYLSILTAVQERPTAHTILSGEQLETIQPRSGRSQGGLLSPLVFSLVCEAVQDKEVKRMQTGREMAAFLSADDGDHRHFTRKLVETMGRFSHVSG